jgi:hypothetical protein
MSIYKTHILKMTKVASVSDMISVGVGRIRADPTHMGRTFPEQS